MTRSLCTSCGLRSQHCQCRQQDSTAANANANVENGERAFKLTPVSFWVYFLSYPLAMSGFLVIMYFSVIHPAIKGYCYLEVFADSFSLSTANATADWNVGFTTRNPGNGCKSSLHTIKSRLFRDNKLISESSASDSFGQFVTGKIKTVETPQGGVVWDLRVEVVSSVITKGRFDSGNGFLILSCGDIPVKFTVDPAGIVMGSLLGNMRPCEYDEFEDERSEVVVAPRRSQRPRKLNFKYSHTV